MRWTGIKPRRGREIRSILIERSFALRITRFYFVRALIRAFTFAWEFV